MPWWAAIQLNNERERMHAVSFHMQQLWFEASYHHLAPVCMHLLSLSVCCWMFPFYSANGDDAICTSLLDLSHFLFIIILLLLSRIEFQRVDVRSGDLATHFLYYSLLQTLFTLFPLFLFSLYVYYDLKNFLFFSFFTKIVGHDGIRRVHCGRPPAVPHRPTSHNGVANGCPADATVTSRGLVHQRTRSCGKSKFQCKRCH